ncbi:MAG: DUF4838 domain-containing protein [bacterium]
MKVYKSAKFKGFIGGLSGMILSLTVLNCSAGNLELVKKGQAKVCLVLPATPKPDEKLAADELSDFFEKISGVKVGIVTNVDMVGGLIPVKIGLSLCPEAEKLSRDSGSEPAAFMLRVQKDGVWLAGLAPEGTLFAAYELLEQLGVGWYMPGDLGTIIPSTRTIALPIQQTIQIPSFKGRHLQAIGDGTWAKRMRLGGFGAGGHGLPIKADAKIHPEMFCQENGQPTHQLEVSNPEVLRLAIEAALKYFRKNPSEKYISMSPNDGAGFGSSPWDASEMDPLHGKISATDRYVRFYNLVLAEVHKEFPDAGIAFYCYGQLMRPPVKEMPDKHILPVFAPIDLCRFHSIENPICPERQYMKQIIARWQELGCEIYYRGYYFNLSDQGLPFSMIRQISDELPFFYNNKIVGCRVECMPIWGFHGPSLYLASKLMWSAKADAKAIMDDYFKALYGPAAQPISKFFDILEDTYGHADYHTGNVFDIPHILTTDILNQLDEQLSAAEKLTSPESDFAKRIQRVRMSQEYGKANLVMMAAFNDGDFKKSKEEYLKVSSMILEGNKLTPPLFAHIPVAYLKRFWGGSIDSAYEGIEKGNRIVARLPDQWLFMLDPLNGGEALGFYKPAMGPKNWLKMKTYSESWGNQGLRYYKGEAWYRTAVNVDKKFKGETIHLWLGGIDDMATAWINGEKLDCLAKGAAPIGKAWEFDCTGAIRFGQENVIVIKVSNREVNELGTGGITGPAMLWTVSRKESL